jgi:hypothetical protein
MATELANALLARVFVDLVRHQETIVQLHGNGPWWITYLHAKDAAHKK